MITKDEILEKLQTPYISDKHRTILKLALKWLESENLIWGNRIVVNNLNYEIDGLNRSRNFWRKKYESLANELDEKIISLINERDAFQRLNGELRTENSCMRANLENSYKELSVLKDEIVKHEENYRSKNAFINKVLTENEELKIKIEKFESFFHG